jgi:hypothetical protein
MAVSAARLRLPVRESISGPTAWNACSSCGCSRSNVPESWSAIREKTGTSEAAASCVPDLTFSHRADQCALTSSLCAAATAPMPANSAPAAASTAGAPAARAAPTPAAISGRVADDRQVDALRQLVAGVPAGLVRRGADRLAEVLDVGGQPALGVGVLRRLRVVLSCAIASAASACDSRCSSASSREPSTLPFSCASLSRFWASATASVAFCSCSRAFASRADSCST